MPVHCCAKISPEYSSTCVFFFIIDRKFRFDGQSTPEIFGKQRHCRTDRPLPSSTRLSRISQHSIPPRAEYWSWRREYTTGNHLLKKSNFRARAAAAAPKQWQPAQFTMLRVQRDELGSSSLRPYEFKN